MSAVPSPSMRRTPVPFVDLARQHDPIRDQIEAAISEVVARGDFILGEAVTRFERNFADYLGVRHAVGVASGTAALTIALRAAGVAPGDEVLVPAHTFSATALAVIHAGAEPAFCDVDAETGLIDPASAAAAITPRTTAIIAVHLYGQVVDVEPLLALCERESLVLIEDAAQAHGASFGGRRAGSLGTASAFSFYPSKNLGAFGDGGIVCTDDEEIADDARRWRNLGQEGKGPHRVPAGNERLDTLQAAVLDVKLPYLDEWNRQRQIAAAQYRELLPAGLGLLPDRPSADDVYHLFPVVIGAEGERDRVREGLTAAGVGTGIHYTPAVHLQPALASRGGGAGVDLAQAERWARQELSLPIFAGITEQEVVAVCSALADALAMRPATIPSE